MHPVTLLLGIHNHQPVGNFAHVFRKAYERCYRPFLDVLERHPHVRLTVHYTGPLLEWFEQEEPAFLDRLAKLVMANQVEILGGGFYEPILSVIPDRDAVGQVTLLSRWLHRRLGATPRGLWLAERAWEGLLPKKLAPTGLRYTILDDSHFVQAGLDPGSLSGYYLTEKEGHPLAIFPISKDLRYLIPFRVPEDLIGLLARLGERGSEVAVTYADDGEKFGLWPDTYQWVYEEGYLERLFAALEQESSWLRLQTFGEHLDAHPPTGRVYLPTASYEELMEWALPVPAAKALEERRAELDRAGRLAAFQPFLRGGFWDGFLLKYSEANHMHKRMLDVSARVAQAFPSGTDVPEPVRLVWRAQGNDAYWHGLFGGLYLNYLRHETYRNLIEAETRVETTAHQGREWLTMRGTDLDLDGHEEIVISSRSLGVILAPACGGSLLELDYRPRCFNLSDVLTRREEAYHGKLAEAAMRQGSSGGAPASIHDQLRVKEQGLDQVLRYDRHRRVSFLDRFLSPAISWEAFDRIDDEERGDCASGVYHAESERPASQEEVLTVPMAYQGTVSLDGRTYTLSLHKVYRVTKRDPAVEVAYAIANQAAVPCAVRFGVELNLTLLAGNDPQRYYEMPDRGRVRLHERGQCPATDRFSMVDEWSRLRVILCLERPGEIWYMPIETVSRSEEGVERTYQGSALLASWLLTLQPGASERVKVRLEIADF